MEWGRGLRQVEKEEKRRMGASIPTLEGWGRKETGKEGDDEWERMAMRIRAKKEDMEI